jgi:hypothetical protein
VDIPGSGSCPVAVFSVRGIESSSTGVTVVVN